MPKGIPKNGVNRGWFKKGYKMPKKIREQISKALIGVKKRPFTFEHRRKLSKIHKGNKYALGYRHTEETKRKLSKIWKGKHLSEEHKRKIKEALKGKKPYEITERTRQKMSGAHKNKRHSEKTKEKMSKTHEGKKPYKMTTKIRKKISEGMKQVMKNPENRKRLRETWKGKKHSEETKEKMSEAHRGEKSYLWQGGKSFEPYGIEFNNQLKGKIRKRDNCTCQECDINQKDLGYKLHVHHVDYNKKNNNPDNLISLCRSCHLQTNFKREDWTNYFSQKLWNKIKIKGS